MRGIKFFLLLFFIAFWFKGNTLFWTDGTKTSPSNYLKFQLDHKNPPTINKEPISSMKVYDNEVYIIAGDKCWILHYDQNPQGLDWYVENPFNI